MSVWKFKVDRGFAKVVRGKRTVIGDLCTFQNPPVFRKKRNPEPGESKWLRPKITHSHYFDEDDDTFPLGFLDRIKRHVRINGNALVVENQDPFWRWDVPADYCFVHTAKKHQLAAARRMLRHWCATIEVATAGGKTLIMSMIAAWLARKYGLNILVMVPGKDLLGQNYTKMSEYIGDEFPIGRIGDGRHEIDKQITIGISASLIRGVPEDVEYHDGETERRVPNRQIHEYLQTVDVLIADECQSVGADTWFWTGIECKALAYYAFSGTVETKDLKKDSRREALFGPVRYRVPAKELIGKGILATPTIYYLLDDSIYKEVPADAEYPTAYSEGIVRSLRYNSFVARLANALATAKRQVIVNVRRRSQGLLLRRLLLRRGVRSKYVDGTVPSGVRDKIKDDFSNKHLHVIVATRVFDAGIDLPLADALIQAGGEKAHIGLKQRIGRVLRAPRGKDRAVVFDFSHDAHWILVRHAIQRLKVYEDEGHEVVGVKSKRDMIRIASRRTLEGASV